MPFGEVRSLTGANPPGVPTLVLPALNALTTDYTPRLDWSTVSVPAGTTFHHYQVQAATDSLFTSLAINESGLTDINASEFTPVSDLAANTKFYWRVRAYNDAGQYSL